MVYFNIMNLRNGCFAVSCYQMCHHAGGEKMGPSNVLKSREMRGKTHVTNGGNLQSATLYKFS